jgi:hypothetical protein
LAIFGAFLLSHLAEGVIRYLSHFPVVRNFLILMVLGSAVWCGHRYAAMHPDGDFWNPLGLHLSQLHSPASLSGGDHSINECRDTLKSISAKALAPLDEANDFSNSNASQILRDTRQDLQAYGSSPEYDPLIQADDLLVQVLQDRKSNLDSLLKAEAPPSGQRVLSDDNDAFFKERAHDRASIVWTERCNYYRPLLDRLLSPSG